MRATYLRALANAGDYLWANKPLAAGNAKAVIFVSDVGSAGTYFRSNGTNWLPVDGKIVWQSNDGWSLTGTLVETVMRQVSAPGGLVPSSGVTVMIKPIFTGTSSANAKTYKVKIGTGTYISAAPTTAINFQNAAFVHFQGTAAQFAYTGTAAAYGASGTATALVTSTVDTASAWTIDFVGLLANVGETITLKGYVVEMFF